MYFALKKRLVNLLRLLLWLIDENKTKKKTPIPNNICFANHGLL